MVARSAVSKAPEAPPMPRPDAASPRRRLLVAPSGRTAEDVRHYVTRFEHGCQYDLVTASTRAELLECLRPGPPALFVIVGGASPEILDVLSALRQYDRTIPVVGVANEPARLGEIGLFACLREPLIYSHFEHVVALACGIHRTGKP
jgi:hypothetical protein